MSAKRRESACGQRMKKALLYAGIERDEYEGIQDEIDISNREMLERCTWAALGLFTVLYISSWWIDAISPNSTLYLAVMLLVAVLMGLERTILLRFPHLVLLCSYALLTIVYGYSIMVGSVQNAYPATTFCILLFAGPFLFVDRPYRMTIYTALVSVVFCISSHHWKTPEVASLDTVNTICFVLLGTACNIQLLNTKAKGLAYNKKTTQERDTDGLTGLLVKTALERDICRYIRFTRDPGALIIIDLDDFKRFNDTKGHAYGDRILKLTGSCIQKTFRSTDIKGRFGGDEFVIFLEGNASRTIVSEKLDKFRALMIQGADEEELDRVTQSIGVALYPEDAGEYGTLFEKADEALYESKKRGKDQYCYYTSVRIQRNQQGKGE